MIRYTEVRLDAGSIKELPDGSIRVTGQLTRPGIFTYRNPDGTERREYRPREEVFSPRTKETFASTTVTMNHPSRGVGQRKVSPDTWQKDAVGHMGETIRQDGDYLVGDLFIREAKAVAGVKSGEVKFVSLGYDVDYDPTPGTDPEGGRYDGVQRKIVGNHVALLPPGIAPRGGEGCSLRLDAAGDEDPFRTDDVVGASAPALDCGRAMPEPTNPALVAAEAQITALKGELDKSRADAVDVTALKAKVTELTAENAKLLAQLTPERLDALASERAALVAVAKDAGIDARGQDVAATETSGRGEEDPRPRVARRQHGRQRPRSGPRGLRLLAAPDDGGGRGPGRGRPPPGGDQHGRNPDRRNQAHLGDSRGSPRQTTLAFQRPL